MKLALINPIFSRRHGGGEKYPLDLAQAMIDLGHEVHLVGHLIESAPAAAVRHLLIPPRRPRLLRPLLFSRRVEQLLAKERFDFSYAMTRSLGADATFLGGGVAVHHLAMRYPRTLARWCHIALRPVNLVNNHLERQLYHRNPHAYVVANSELAKGHLMQFYDVPAAHIFVVRHGIDHVVFNLEARAKHRAATRVELGIGDGDMAVVFVANNYRLKGLPVLIEATGILRRDVPDHPMRIIVVGKGKAAEYRLLAHKHGVGDRLYFVGQSTEVHRYYAAGDVFALPTQYDPFAVVTLEAMACGLPAVTSRENGACEVIEAGRTGYVLESPRDARELAECLRQLVDADVRQRMGQAAAATTLPFTHRANAVATLDAFAAIAKARRGRHVEY